MDRDKKIFCLGCLRKKERIDELERRYLMLETWAKQLRSDITSVVGMVDEIGVKLALTKTEWENEFLGCIEED
jgi:hypothetical protein